ncbi:MAG: InlB B-repeat-containing protein [Lachnospiraceae bacterium]|nr:InlB B-repeat-containing protein [Lachnospiraceae bacterium]
MKKVLKLRLPSFIALFLCVVLVAGTVGTKTAAAAESSHIISIVNDMKDIEWIDDGSNTITVAFPFSYKATKSVNSVTFTWEEKHADKTEFETCPLMNRQKNPSTVDVWMTNSTEKKLTISSAEGLRLCKEGMLIHCKIQYKENGKTVTIYTRDARLYYKAVVKYVVNNKEASRENVAYGEKATKPADPVNGTQKFLGWYTKDNKEFTFDTAITAPLTLYAKFADVHTVSFDLNGKGNAADTPESQSVIDGQNAKRPDTVPEDEDYIFQYWSTDKNGRTAFDFSKTQIKKNTVLYAIWKEKPVEKVSVTFVYAQNGHNHGYYTNATSYIPKGSKISKPADPDCRNHIAGHAFLGWYADKDCKTEFDFDQEITENTVIYAKWCLGHNKTETKNENPFDPTCTEYGHHDVVVYCKNCGTELSRVTVNDLPLGHIDGEVIETVLEAATCTGEGTVEVEHKCGRCGETISTETTHPEALGHDLSGEAVKTITKEATCTEEGAYVLVKYCQRKGCDHSEEVGSGTIGKIAHKYGEPVEENVKTATCTEEGSYDLYKYCEACGDKVFVETVTVKMRPHDLGEAVIENVKEADCHNKGSYDLVKHCKNCDYFEIVDTIIVDEKEHVPGEAKQEEIVEATCTAPGSYKTVIYCVACGDKLSSVEETIPAKGHVPGEAKEEQRVEPTCDKPGSYESVIYCKVCGEKMSSTTITIPATGDHVASKAVVENAKAATCTKDGSYDSVIYCADCGEVISRETITVKAHGHKEKAAKTENFKDSTCTETGSYDTVIYCEICGEELSRKTNTIALKDHKPGAATHENKVDPTYTSAGSYDEVVKCTVCGKTLSTTTITVDKLVPGVQEITLTGLDKAKKDYLVGEKINLDGVEVVTKMTDGTEKRVAVTEEMVTGFDSSKPIASLTLTINGQGITGNYNIAVNPAPVYTVEGDTTWDGENDMKLTVHRSYDDQITFSLFMNLVYKDKVVDTNAYDAASGSLKLNLHKDYLKSLGEGTHAITVNFKDGTVTVDIVVPKLAEEKKEEPKQEEKKEEPKKEENKTEEKKDESTPKTSDTGAVTVWFILLLLAMIAASAAMYSNRKRESEI